MLLKNISLMNVERNKSRSPNSMAAEVETLHPKFTASSSSREIKDKSNLTSHLSHIDHHTMTLKRSLVRKPQRLHRQIHLKSAYVLISKRDCF